MALIHIFIFNFNRIMMHAITTDHSDANSINLCGQRFVFISVGFRIYPLKIFSKIDPLCLIPSHNCSQKRILSFTNFSVVKLDVTRTRFSAKHAASRLLLLHTNQINISVGAQHGFQCDSFLQVTNKVQWKMCHSSYCYHFEEAFDSAWELNRAFSMGG